jgi:imidazolonepropionase-like amidohydrolase
MRRIFLFFCFVFCQVLAAFSQPVDEDLPQVTGCIALLNAKVVSAPGKAPVVSTVVMRDGLITQVGINLKIPADAYRIAADSFYVYPAFIDAFSDTGIKEPEESGSPNQGPGNRGQRPAVDAEGNPSLEDAGITPYKGIRATFDGMDKSVSDWRAQGFAIAHVVPKGKMIPGKGSIVVLSGKGTDQMLWKEDISMFGQWTGAGGSYPSTVIGVMAKWRELYHNASQYVTHQASYENAVLVSRPNYNQAHEALVPVVKKEMQVFFRAPKVKDISRAISMQKDLNMKMVIADAEESWYLKDQLKSGQLPLILSMDLPEDKSEAKAEAKAKVDTSTSSAQLSKPDSTVVKEISIDTVKIDPEKEAFEKRRAESLKMHREQAATLAKEGIAFSFGTMSVKPGDFSKNMQIMIENGLPADKALSALTTQPARLLGVEKYCGTVDIGKMANLIVSTKPLFEKDAAIRYMIVEGTLYEYEVKEKKKSNGKEVGNGKEGPAAFAILEGTWKYAIETPDQKREGKLEFTNGTGELKGTISGSDITTGNNELEDIVLDGTTASFTFDFDMGGQIVVLEFDLTLNGETFEGTVTVGEFGSFPVTGARTSKPN